MGRLRFEDNIKQWGDRAVSVFDSALERMAKDIVQIAKITVPFKEGDLMKEIMTEKLAVLAHRVVVNIEYASFQERGKRKDGTHVVRKYSTPNTGAHFLENAGVKVTETALEYLKQANQLIKY